MKKLEPRQKRFVQEYLVDLNATQAAIRAGYSKKTARQQAEQLLTKPYIKRAVEAAMKKREEKTEITAARVLQELAIIAFSDIKNYTDIDPDTGTIRAKAFEDMPPGSSRALEAISENRTIREDAKGEDSILNSKTTFKMHSKTKALDLAMQHLGMLKMRIDAPDLEDALNKHALSIGALRKSLDAYRKEQK